MKTQNKIFASLTAILLIMMSLIMPAFAAENNAESPIGSSPDNPIVFESEQEYNAFVAELEESNQRAEALWQEALKNSEKFYAPEELQNKPTPRFYDRISKEFDQFFGSGFYGNLVCYLNCDRNGSTFNDVYEFGLYGNSGSITNVTNVNYNGISIIDGGRTAAVSCSATVYVKHNPVVGIVEAFNIVKYIEFYGSGTALVYS